MEGAPYRVLHVEDNDFFARVTTDVLEEEHDMSVHRVESAAEALESLESQQCDCIVSDYEMPGMDGLELLNEIRKSYPELPFILLTGGGSEDTASRAVSKGVTDYLQKGTGKQQFTALANRIENAVSRRRAEKIAEQQIEVNDLIWDTSQALLQSSSRKGIEETVCERLAASELYWFVWLGKTDSESNDIRMQTAAGGVGDYPESVRGFSPTTRTIVEQTLENRTLTTERTTAGEDGDERDDEIDLGRHSKAAIPLEYEDTLYGVLVLCTGRRHALDETEQRLLSKFGNSIAYAISSVRTRKELVRREQRLQVFNRILRHNLRNDLNVVLGHAENLIEDVPDAEDEAKIIKRKASELIDISEKAREVGKTLDKENKVNDRVDVTRIIEQTCDKITESNPAVTFNTTLPEEVYVQADKTLDAAISEVIENAIEHNDAAEPRIELSTDATELDGEEWVEISVTDNGPGIPEEERAVLIEGKETALRHGSGLGLWLANWIVGKFGGDLLFTDNRTGTTVTLRLRRANHERAKQ